MPIAPASPTDIPALVRLLNAGYRGESSKKGWTTEAHLIEGELRTDDSSVAKLMDTREAIFLKYTDEGGQLSGCVFLHKQGNRMYLGMLSVDPSIQARGIGKQLMQAGEKFAREKECSYVFMKVISLRHELIAWYERQAYHPTGQTESFPTDERFGKPLQPIEFIVLEKKL